MTNPHAQYFLPPRGTAKAQILELKSVLFASKALLIWSLFAAVLDLAFGQLHGFESVGRLIAGGVGLFPMILAGAAAGNVKLDRGTYWGFIRRGAGFGLVLVVFAALFAFNAGPETEPNFKLLFRGLSSAVFVTPAATYLALGLMRYWHHQDRKPGDEGGNFEA